jgi:hypothetical protein
MSEPVPPSGVRIGSAERDAALDSLGAHLRAGRLDPEEYSDRVAAVATARYTSDLMPLFADLPADPAGPSPAAAPVSLAKPGRPVLPRSRLMALVPLVALVLFFVFGFAGGWSWSWLFFLLVPMVATLNSGEPNGASEGSAARRARRRGRRS